MVSEILYKENIFLILFNNNFIHLIFYRLILLEILKYVFEIFIKYKKLQ